MEAGKSGFRAYAAHSAARSSRLRQRIIDQHVKPEIPCLSKRYTVVVLTCFGFIFLFGLRFNLKCLIKHPIHADTSNGTTLKMEISKFSVSFLHGYLISQPLGGIAACIYPANKVFGIVVALSSVYTLSIPLYLDVYEKSHILRICHGLIEGMAHSVCGGLWRHWAPLCERYRILTIVLCETYTGLFVSLPMIDILIQQYDQSIFFIIFGTIGSVWYVVWLWLIFEKPSLHPTISPEERAYIEHSSITNAFEDHGYTAFRHIPWRRIFTSNASHAIIVAQYCLSLSTALAFSFKNNFSQSIRSVAHADRNIINEEFVSYIPFLFVVITLHVTSEMVDYIQKKRWASATNTMKFIICGCLSAQAFIFLILPFIENGTVFAIFFICFMCLNGLSILGLSVNCLDIASKYSGILMGVSNTLNIVNIYFFVNIFFPFINNQGDVKKIVGPTNVILLAGAVFYGIRASGDQQPWAEPRFDSIRTDTAVA